MYLPSVGRYKWTDFTKFSNFDKLWYTFIPDKFEDHRTFFVDLGRLKNFSLILAQSLFIDFNPKASVALIWYLFWWAERRPAPMKSRIRLDWGSLSRSHGIEWNGSFQQWDQWINVKPMATTFAYKTKMIKMLVFQWFIINSELISIVPVDRFRPNPSLLWVSLISI